MSTWTDSNAPSVAHQADDLNQYPRRDAIGPPHPDPQEAFTEEQWTVLENAAQILGVSRPNLTGKLRARLGPRYDNLLDRNNTRLLNTPSAAGVSIDRPYSRAALGNHIAIHESRVQVIPSIPSAPLEQAQYHLGQEGRQQGRQPNYCGGLLTRHFNHDSFGHDSASNLDSGDNYIQFEPPTFGLESTIPQALQGASSGSQSYSTALPESFNLADVNFGQQYESTNANLVCALGTHARPWQSINPETSLTDSNEILNLPQSLFTSYPAGAGEADNEWAQVSQ